MSSTGQEQGRRASPPPSNAVLMHLSALHTRSFHYVAADDSTHPSAIFITDSKAHVVRRWDPDTGTQPIVQQLEVTGVQQPQPHPPCPCPAGELEVFAGAVGQPGYRDGPGARARFRAPTAACSLPGGRLAVADSLNQCLRLVDVNAAEVSTLAGACGERAGFADGAGPDARFGAGIRSLACLSNCTVLVADAGVGRLRRIDVYGGSACPPDPHRHHHFPTLWSIALIWLMGGAAVLAAVVLGVRAWAAEQAAAVDSRLRDVRAAHRVGMDTPALTPAVSVTPPVSTGWSLLRTGLQMRQAGQH